MGQRRCADSVAEKGAKRMNTLFNQPLKVVNAGLHSFADNIQHAGGSNCTQLAATSTRRY